MFSKKKTKEALFSFILNCSCIYRRPDSCFFPKRFRLGRRVVGRQRNEHVKSTRNRERIQPLMFFIYINTRRRNSLENQACLVARGTALLISRRRSLSLIRKRAADSNPELCADEIKEPSSLTRDIPVKKCRLSVRSFVRRTKNSIRLCPSSAGVHRFLARLRTRKELQTTTHFSIVPHNQQDLSEFHFRFDDTPHTSPKTQTKKNPRKTNLQISNGRKKHSFSCFD